LREGETNHPLVGPQVKWTFVEKYSFAKRIDVEWIDNFTVVSEKSRLRRIGDKKEKVSLRILKFRGV